MSTPHGDQPSWPQPPARPNPSLYSHRNIRLLYTPLVIGFSHPRLWRVSNSAIRDLYRTHTAPAHVEVRPGNAHWLRPLAPRTVDLIDLNRTCLRVSHDRLDRRGWNVRVHEQSATTPWPLEAESVGSVGSSMLLHCLPGTGFGDKLAFFTEAHRVLHQGGRLFGATVLGRNDPAPISRLGARMRATYNRSGAFTSPGDTAADLHQVLERLAPTLEEHGARPRRLTGAPPAHSREVKRYLPLLQHDLEVLRPQAGYRTMVSTCTGTAVEGTDLDAAYWARQVRSPVQWEQAITHLARTGPLHVVEVSPHPVLTVPTAQTRARHHLEVAISAPGHEPGSLAQAGAALHTHGAAVGWPYPTAPPVEMEPTPWDEDATTPSWGQRVAELTGQERLAELTLHIHHLVQGLAPVTVEEKDRQAPLERLGLNSMDRLSLRALLATHLPVDASQVGEHEPTIASIAQAVHTAMPTPLPPEPG